MYYVIQDTNAGFIHWLGEAESKKSALEKFSTDIGGTDEGDLEFIELNESQYNTLNQYPDGQDQEAIDYLESIK